MDRSAYDRGKDAASLRPGGQRVRGRDQGESIISGLVRGLLTTAVTSRRLQQQFPRSREGKWTACRALIAGLGRGRRFFFLLSLSFASVPAQRRRIRRLIQERKLTVNNHHNNEKAGGGEGDYVRSSRIAWVEDGRILVHGWAVGRGDSGRNGSAPSTSTVHALVLGLCLRPEGGIQSM